MALTEITTAPLLSPISGPVPVVVQSDSVYEGTPSYEVWEVAVTTAADGDSYRIAGQTYTFRATPNANDPYDLPLPASPVDDATLAALIASVEDNPEATYRAVVVADGALQPSRLQASAAILVVVAGEVGQQLSVSTTGSGIEVTEVRNGSTGALRPDYAVFVQPRIEVWEGGQLQTIEGPYLTARPEPAPLGVDLTVPTAYPFYFWLERLLESYTYADAPVLDVSVQRRPGASLALMPRYGEQYGDAAPISAGVPLRRYRRYTGARRHVLAAQLAADEALLRDGFQADPLALFSIFNGRRALSPVGALEGTPKRCKVGDDEFLHFWAGEGIDYATLGLWVQRRYPDGTADPDFVEVPYDFTALADNAVWGVPALGIARDGLPEGLGRANGMAVALRGRNEPIPVLLSGADFTTLPDPASAFPNGDFEAGNVDGWQVSGGTVAISTDTPYAGTYCLRAAINPNSAGGGQSQIQGRLQYPLSADAGAYIIPWYFRLVDGVFLPFQNVRATATIVDSAEVVVQEIALLSTSRNVPGSWVPACLAFNAPAAGTYFLRFDITSDPYTPLEVDDSQAILFLDAVRLNAPWADFWSNRFAQDNITTSASEQAGGKISVQAQPSQIPQDRSGSLTSLPFASSLTPTAYRFVGTVEGDLVQIDVSNGTGGQSYPVDPGATQIDFTFELAVADQPQLLLGFRGTQGALLSYELYQLVSNITTLVGPTYYALDGTCPEERLTLGYINRYGVYEALHLEGHQELEVEVERSTYERNVANTYSGGPRIRETYETTTTYRYTARTGQLWPYEAALVEDLLKSRDVWAVAQDGNGGKQLVPVSLVSDALSTLNTLEQYLYLEVQFEALRALAFWRPDETGTGIPYVPGVGSSAGGGGGLDCQSLADCAVITTLRTQVQDLQAQMDANTQSIDALSGQVGTLGGRVDALDTQLNDPTTGLETRFTTLQGGLEGVQTDLIAFQDETAGNFDTVNGRLDAVEGVNTTQNDRLDAIEAEQTTQNNRLTAVEATNATQQGTLNNVQDNINTLFARVDTVTLANQQTQGELETLRTNTELSIADLQIQDALLSGRLDDLEAEQPHDNTQSANY